MTLVICVLAGAWADTKWGIRPWGTIAGSLLGIGGAMYAVVKETMR